MQNNPNQTNQKDPDNRGLDGSEMIPEQIRLLWCANATLDGTKLSPEFCRYIKS